MLGHTITVFLGFFAIMNPIANTAVFVGLTDDAGQAERKRIALKAVLTTLSQGTFLTNVRQFGQRRKSSGMGLSPPHRARVATLWKCQSDT